MAKLSKRIAFGKIPVGARVMGFDPDAKWKHARKLSPTAVVRDDERFPVKANAIIIMCNVRFKGGR